MTPKQKTLYWFEWRSAAAALKAAGRKADSAARYALHFKALGYNRSSKDLINEEFDKILAVFRAWSQPSDLNAQLRLIDEAPRRIRVAQAHAYNLSEQLWPTKRGGVYFEAENKLKAMAKRICRMDFESLDERQLQRLIGVLERKVPKPASSPSEVKEPDPF